eukprot:6186220-Pleurochrysis_carterae.AAC.2
MPQPGFRWNVIDYGGDNVFASARRSVTSSLSLSPGPLSRFFPRSLSLTPSLPSTLPHCLSHSLSLSLFPPPYLWSAL